MFIQQDALYNNLIKYILDLNNRVEDLERNALTSQDVVIDTLRVLEATRLEDELQVDGFVLGQKPNLGRAIARYLVLPGLVGFWTFGIHGSTGNILDLTNNNISLVPTSGTITMQNTTGGIPNCLIQRSATEYLNAADAAILDITGTETYLGSSSRGLTMGLWVRVQSDSLSTNDGWMAKWASGQQSYGLMCDLAGGVGGQNQPGFWISNTGSDNFSITSGTEYLDTLTWYFVVGRFEPSTEINLFIGTIGDQEGAGTWKKYSNVSSIPASIFSGSADFQIGARGGGNHADIKGALAFLCKSRLSDTMIKDLWRESKYLF